MKVLVTDIETTPNLADVWGLWQQNVSLSQLRESTRMLCFVAKWVGERGTIFYSEHSHTREEMVQAAWDLLDEADAVVHYNGVSFDIPHLNREFAAAGLLPPSPFKQIDLMKAARKQFRLPSYKLEYVSRFFGLNGKLGHEGHTLWVKCMAGDEAAWKKMERYNRRDVVLTEQLYQRMLPWIKAHPNVVLYDTDDKQQRCALCKSTDLEKRGFSYTDQSKFQRYQCRNCGKWLRDTHAMQRVSIKEAV